MKNRTFFVLVIALSLATLPLRAAEAPRRYEPLALWPGIAPGDKGDIGEEKDTTKHDPNVPREKEIIRLGNVSKPTITVFRPAADKETGAAVVVCPGGGYSILAYDLEGSEVCEWLNSIGVTGVLLKYRVPGRGEQKYTAPLQDAQRAVGLVRSRASEWGIDPKRVGILGFSAGGHLSAAASTNYETRIYPTVDDADKESCRPDFTLLIYPAYLTVKDDLTKIAPELVINAKTPPAFLAMAQDDPVHVENAYTYALALKAAKVRAEIHIYPTGGHGYGLRPSEHAVTTWPRRAGDWMKTQGFLAMPDPSKPVGLAKQLIEGTAPAKTAAEFEAAYTQVLPPLLAKPEGDDSTLQKIVFRANRPGAEMERATLSKVLSARLSAGGSTPVKVLLLRHIQRIGREETVAMVAPLLADANSQVRECARRALANNPTRSAADAIRTAIDNADDMTWKGALVSALAHRRDTADAPVFAKAAAATDEAVRIPALIALARTGDASAAPVLAAARESGTDAGKAAANDAYLLLADRLITLDERAAASKIYREYLFSPQRYRYAAIIGLGTAGTEEDVPKFLNLLNDKDLQARGAALEALAKRRDPGTGSEILIRLAKADPVAKPWLLRALIGQGDKRARQALLDAAADADEVVRIQALVSLAQWGDTSAVPLLLKSATAKGEEQNAARSTLDVLPDKSVDAALLERIASDTPAVRTEVIRAIGARRTPNSVEPLFTAAQDAEGAVRSEAFKSLALVAEFDALPRALNLLLQAKEDRDRDPAIKTVVAIARKNDNVDARSAPVLSELERTEGPVRAALLNILGQLGGDKALAAIRTAVKSDDEKTHEAGVRALTAWPDTTPIGDLLALAKEDKNNTLAILSLRAYIRLAGLPSKRPVNETVKLFQEALPVIKRNDEKKMVLGGLGELKDAKALEVVAPFLSDEPVAGEACAAAIKLAKECWEKNKELAKTTMTKVLEVSKTDSQKKAAKEILEKIAPPKKPA